MFMISHFYIQGGQSFSDSSISEGSPTLGCLDLKQGLVLIGIIGVENAL